MPGSVPHLRPALFRRLAALLAIAALALGAQACGGGEEGSGSADDPATVTNAERPQAAVPKTEPGTPKTGGAEGEKRSGGGPGQFRVEGGDNSVQEFGSEASGTDFEEAAQALHNFLDARAAGNWAAACEYLAAGVVESFESLASRVKGVEDMSCAGILERLTNPAAKGQLRKEAAQADVGSVRVEGERAFAIYRGIDGVVIAISMTREGDRWKIAALAGVPLR